MTQTATKMRAVEPKPEKKKDRRSQITERLKVIDRELSNLPGIISRLESDFAKAGSSLEAAEDQRRDKVSDQIEEALAADHSPGGTADLILKIPIVEPKLAQLRDTVAKLKDGIDAAKNKFALLTSEKKALETELTDIENTDRLVSAFEQFDQFQDFYLKAETAHRMFRDAIRAIKDTNLRDWRGLCARCKIDDRFFIELTQTATCEKSMVDFVGQVSRINSDQNKLFDKNSEANRQPRRSGANYKKDTGFHGFGFPRD